MKQATGLWSTLVNTRWGNSKPHLTSFVAAVLLAASPVLAQDVLVIENDKVGIGTSNPSSVLTVKGSGTDHYFTLLAPNNSLAFEVQRSGNNIITADAPGYYWVETDAGGQFWGTMGGAGEYRVRDLTAGTFPLRIEKTAPTNALFIQGTGRIGLGTTTPATRLEIEDTSTEGAVLRLEDSNAFCDLDPDPGELTVSCVSDIRLKRNVRKAALAKLLQEIVTIELFEYEMLRTDESTVGPVAQHLQATHPQRVTEAEDGTLMVNLPSSSELIGAIQELHRLFSAQEAALQQQEELIAGLQERLAGLGLANRE